MQDGHFVDNITLGAPIVKALRKHTDSFMDCHIMVSDPEHWIKVAEKILITSLLIDLSEQLVDKQVMPELHLDINLAASMLRMRSACKS